MSVESEVLAQTIRNYETNVDSISLARSRATWLFATAAASILVVANAEPHGLFVWASALTHVAIIWQTWRILFPAASAVEVQGRRIALDSDGTVGNFQLGLNRKYEQATDTIAKTRRAVSKHLGKLLGLVGFQLLLTAVAVSPWGINL